LNLGENKLPVLNIARLGHPILREIAKPVDLKALTASGGNKLQPLIDDMIDTMREVYQKRKAFRLPGIRNLHRTFPESQNRTKSTNRGSY